ncbi:MAG: SusC/RagA family TonB-linked outer membrane protein [Ginsengibacter sp.]
MRNNYFLLVPVFLFCALSLNAQNKTVIGRITNADNGRPLAGATVSEKGTKRGTVSNASGEYSIIVPENATLIYSNVGFITHEETVRRRSVINISLRNEKGTLGEVVVVGYGTKRKESLTGSIDQISSSQIQDIPLASADQLIQGKAPGVLISSQSGTPGGGVTVRIRGTSSFSPNSPASEPLYIVDGVFINTTPLGSSGYGTEQQYNNPLADINPDDIASISILKDADATAIYGSRGANGVIIITTKRGSFGQKTHVTLNTYFGQASAWRLPKLTTGPETAELLNEVWINKGNDPTKIPYPNPQSEPTYDRVHEIFRKAPVFNTDLNVSGGNDKTTFYLGVNYFKQDGIMRPQTMDRESFRFNLDHKINSRLKVGTSNSLARTFRKIVPNDNSFGIMLVGLGTASLYPDFNSDGSYFWGGPLGNVEAMIRESDETNMAIRTINNIYAEWEVVPNLTFRSSWSIDFNQSLNRGFSSTILNGPGSLANGYESTNYEFTWINEQTLRYNFQPTNSHNFTFLVGNTTQETTLKGFGVGASNYPNNDLRNLSSAAQADWWSGSKVQSSLASIFGRMDYSYKSKYLLSLNAREDASSKFGANNRWGFFPAVGAGWRIDKENFMSKQNLINNLKLKASYGITGSQMTISEYAAKGLWGGGFNYLGNPGTAPIQLANPDLKWEQTSQFNAGLEFGFLGNRIEGEIDYYNKKTEGVLLNEPVPNSTGFSVIANNAGDISNKGFEFSIDGDIIKRNDFTWNVNFNIAYNKNMIVKLAAPYFEPFSRNFIIFEQGYPVNSFRLWKQLEVDPKTGDAVYQVIDPSVPISNDNNRIIAGNSNPKFTGGFGTNLRFKNFDLIASFSFAWGQHIMNWSEFFMINGGTRSNAATGKATWGFYAKQLDRWQKQGDITDIPKVGGTSTEMSNNYSLFTTRYLENGSFTRLRNLVIGYTIPHSALKGISSLRIYISGTNLLTFTKYTGLDPEINAGGGKGTVDGVEMFTVPQPRVIQAGLNVNF